MPDPKLPQPSDQQHYGTFPNKNPKTKPIPVQNFKTLKTPIRNSVTGGSFVEFGFPQRRQKSTSMNFPRDILRGAYQFTQMINGCTIDSSIFRLNTNATVLLLVTFSLAVTTRQYVGHPIDCVHARDIPEDVLNTYCWIHSTFTVPEQLKKDERSNLISSGIQTSSDKKSVKQIRYYQWVEFFLFIQVIAMLKTSPQLNISGRMNVSASSSKYGSLTKR